LEPIKVRRASSCLFQSFKETDFVHFHCHCYVANQWRAESEASSLTSRHPQCDRPDWFRGQNVRTIFTFDQPYGLGVHAVQYWRLRLHVSIARFSSTSYSTLPLRLQECRKGVAQKLSQPNPQGVHFLREGGIRTDRMPRPPNKIDLVCLVPVHVVGSTFAPSSTCSSSPSSPKACRCWSPRTRFWKGCGIGEELDVSDLLSPPRDCDAGAGRTSSRRAAAHHACDSAGRQAPGSRQRGTGMMEMLLLPTQQIEEAASRQAA
jgi:hypothetical protein